MFLDMSVSLSISFPDLQSISHLREQRRPTIVESTVSQMDCTPRSTARLISLAATSLHSVKTRRDEEESLSLTYLASCKAAIRPPGPLLWHQ